MSFIRSRLRRLEERGWGGTCPECGLPPNGARRIVYERIPEGEPEFCQECGQPLWTIIRVVYEGDEEGEGAE